MEIYGRDNKMMHMMLMDTIEFLPDFGFELEETKGR